MPKKKAQALVTQLAAHDIFGQFRFIEKDNGEIWFVGIDVCKILGYKNSRDALAKHVDDEDKNTVANRDGIPGNPNKVIINESGLYSLIFASQLPTAKKFTRWVTSEVLPSIRQNGYYSLVNEKYQDREYLHKILPTLTEEEKLSLANEPDIVVWCEEGDEKWHVSIDGFADDVR